MPSHRQKTHGAASHLRRLCYRWHRWYGHEVLTHKSGGVYAAFSYACRLPEEPDTILQIPRWMFDTSICAMTHAAEQPRVDCKALHDLLVLIAEQRAAAASAVVKPQVSLPPDGDADGQKSETRSTHAAEPVLGKGQRTAVGRSQRTDASRSRKAPRAAFARGSRSPVRSAKRRSRQ
jgi:hypothetical protein